MTGLNLRTRLQSMPTPEEAFGDLFGSKPDSTMITILKICDLKAYPNQPFALYSEEKLCELAKDIQANGVISPIIVRKLKDENSGYAYYQILAGHNRVNACLSVGIDEIPAIIRDVDDTVASLIVVNTNLNQRDRLLPSEKAFAYKIQHEATKRQGQRLDLKEKEDTNFGPNGSEVESLTNIKRYIRLTYLLPALLTLVDEDSLPFRAGVTLSYLSEDEQQLLHEYIDLNQIKVSLVHAEAIKRYSSEVEPITIEVLDRVFKGDKKQKPSSIKINYNKVSSLLPECFIAGEEMEQYIIKALLFYKENSDLQPNFGPIGSEVASQHS